MTYCIKFVCIILMLLFSASVESRNQYYSWWLEQYSDRSFTGEARCQVCHEQTSGGDGWNAYGWDLRDVFESNRLAIGGGFEDEQAAFHSSLVTLEEFKTEIGNASSPSYLDEILDNAQPGWKDDSNNRILFKDETFKFVEPPNGLPCLTKIDASSIEQPCPDLSPVFDVISKEELNLSLEKVSSGFNDVVTIASINGSSANVLYVAERSGQIWEIDLRESRKRLFLDLSDSLLAVTSIEGDRRGLIGFAFHPNYPENKSVITHLSKAYRPNVSDFPVQVGEADHLSVVSQWQITDPASDVPALISNEKEILLIERSDQNPKGGEVLFGPDGLLYIAIGAEDQFSSMPNSYSDVGAVLSGSVLRIDIDSLSPLNGRYSIPNSNPFVGENGVEEIYARGFRHPQGLSFSRDLTLGIDSLFLSDKGLNYIEEVNRIRTSDQIFDFGWHQKEGAYFRYITMDGEYFLSDISPEGADTAFVDPLAQYGRDEGGSAVPGTIYNGADIKKLSGQYVFSDNAWGEFKNQSRLFYLDEKQQIVDISSTLFDDLSIQMVGSSSNGGLFVIADNTKGESDSVGLYEIKQLEQEICIAVRAKNLNFFTICL